MRKREWWRRALAVATGVLVVHGTACSPLMMKRAPKGPIDPTPPLECTTSLEAPILDTAAAALGVGVIVASAVTWSQAEGMNKVGYSALGLVGGILVGVFTPIAILGYIDAGNCEKLKEAQLSCVSGVESSCQVLKDRKAPPPGW